jgi:membrane dipeptidase
MTNKQDKYLGMTSANRRTFMAGAIALPALASPSIVRAASDPLADKIVINTLGSLFGYDAPYPNKPATEPVIVESLPEMVTDSAVRDSLAAGMTAVNVTVGHVAGNTDPFEHTVADIARWNRILRQRSAQLLHVLSVADIRRAKAEGKIGVIYGFQNSLMLGDKPERVDLFAGLGLRVLQLTYNKAVPVGDGSTAPENRPLTPFGRSVVERANAKRVLCDLSHSGEQTCLDTIRSS